MSQSNNSGSPDGERVGESGAGVSVHKTVVSTEGWNVGTREREMSARTAFDATEPPEIVVPETSRFWPASVEMREHGVRSLRPSFLFSRTLRIVESVSRDFHWIPFFKSQRNGTNSIGKVPEVISVLESVFLAQLKNRFTAAQRTLLLNADCVMVCVEKSSNAVVAYGSTNFSEKGEIRGLNTPVLHGGHMIVAPGYERHSIASHTALLFCFFGHRWWSVFREEIFILRTNNKYIEKLLSVGGDVYRSDSLQKPGSDSENRLRRAVQWTNENLFLSKDRMLFGKPIEITHSFDENVTISGVGPNEIVYLAREVSIATFVLNMTLYLIRRKKK